MQRSEQEEQEASESEQVERATRCKSNRICSAMFDRNSASKHEAHKSSPGLAQVKPMQSANVIRAPIRCTGAAWLVCIASLAAVIMLAPITVQLGAAVSVQKLNVPDLVVIDQLQVRPHHKSSSTLQLGGTTMTAGKKIYEQQRQTTTNQHLEAASLINDAEQAQITFECLISYDKRKDKNLVVKWHHDERIEPIYQWIPELNKRSVAPQYRSFIVPNLASNNSATFQLLNGQQANGSQIEQLEAGFKMVRPSKELGGKYTCSAISSQNDDSKSKKMIVYTPPRSFKFNATRTDLGALLATQRARLIQSAVLSPQLAGGSPVSQPQQQQLPLAYRMRGLAEMQQQPSASTTLPQLFSTIDYVNVNGQRPRAGGSFDARSFALGRQQQVSSKAQPGLKLVCDIEQVFPVPEVSIYRLAKLDGSHPERLAKLDTHIERDAQSGLFHVQVTSIVDESELFTKRLAQQQQPTNTSDEPVYFECLMALTNLELSKYTDNKRSIAYKQTEWTTTLNGGVQMSDALELDQSNGVGSLLAISVSEKLFCALTCTISLVLIMPWLEDSSQILLNL